MVSKLVFKGDNKKNKSTRSTKPSSQSAGISKPRSGPKRSSKDVAAAAAEPETVWSSAKNAAQITGPVVLTVTGDDDAPVCIAADAEGTVFTSTNLEFESSPNTDGSTLLIHSSAPTSVQQVFVIAPASFDAPTHDSSAGAASTTTKKVAFKTSNGTYLTADKLGTLSAKATAVGPQQTFTITVLDNGYWSVETVWDKYLTVEKDDGSLSGFTARADGDSVGFQQSFVIRMQTKYIKTLRSANHTSDRYISSAELEAKAGGPLTRDQIKALKRAYKEGRLNEALLDVRQKKKTDTRCY
ncbi:conserved hypothetical protein [Geotrichum candidum]|uniref:FRG1-like family protein n=1 Tax=Geotrichum candidum TaxID=1173061 RepID=A0A0J9XH69_GEOCN|nr:conserved hypothetical protein [Geotrichum candidum]